MKPKPKDAVVARLAHGAMLVVFPDLDTRIYAESERAVRALERGGWDYFLTTHNSDTGDEFELWIPLHDARWDLDRELELG